jgi:hypothetical protein
VSLFTKLKEIINDVVPIHDVAAKNKDAINNQEKEKDFEKYEHLDFHESKTNSNDEPSRHVRW